MHRIVILTMLVACGGGGRAEPVAPKPVAVVTAAPVPAPSAADANVAYEAKQYDECARIYEAVAATAHDVHRQTPLYNAACCHALAGKPDVAFATLERSVAAGMRDHAGLAEDTDLVSLHADPRWTALIERLKAAELAWEKALAQPELRRELLAMIKDDQAARFAWLKDKTNTALGAAVEVIDRRTTARLKVIVEQSGWPSKSQVGEDGAHAAWLLVQHADKDLAFQKLCLAKIEPLVATGEVTAADHGYLLDRVAVAEKRPQRYGTQFTNAGVPAPIEDEANVDARRKSIGLGTMAEYKVMMQKMNNPAK